jgi:hypothetical protein
MNPDTELDPRLAAYLRSRGDVVAPAGLLDRAHEAALAPPRPGWTAWLTPLLAGGAVVAMAAVVLAVSFRAPVTATTGAGAACPVTVPDGSFRAPPPWPAEPPAYYGSHWFGTADLWTMLDVGGEVWHGLPVDAQGLGQKTFWWSTAFTGGANESNPRITVSGIKLDDPAPRTLPIGGRATNAAADFGEAMLVGVTVPSTGCWELTASYKGHSLSYTVLVE